MARKGIISLSLLSVLLSAPFLQAWGTKKFEPGAKAATLGGAFVARADDASAIYYNPAGLAFLEGVQIKTNLKFFNLKATASVPGLDSEFLSNPFEFYGSFFLSTRLSQRWSLGLGVFNPNIASTEWPWSWTGRPLSLKSKLSAFHIRPVISYKITKDLSVGAGLDFIMSKIQLNHLFRYRYGPESAYEMILENRHSLSGQGIGFVASFLLKISEIFQIGGRYHNRVKMDINGQDWILHWTEMGFAATRKKKNLLQTDQMAINFPYESTSSFTRPSEAALGLVFSPLKSMSLHFDLERINWSSVEDFEIHTIIDEMYAPVEDYKARVAWKDVWNYKGGLEYRFSEVLAIRAGYSYQQSAMDEAQINPVNPDLERNVITLGFGYEGPLFSIYNKEKISELSFDIYFQYVFSKGQQSSLSGFEYFYDSDYFVFGVGLGINLLKK